MFGSDGIRNTWRKPNSPLSARELYSGKIIHRITQTFLPCFAQKKLEGTDPYFTMWPCYEGNYNILVFNVL